MLAMFCAPRSHSIGAGRSSPPQGAAMGIRAAAAPSLASDPFWGPVAFSWPVLLILLAICLLLTIGFVVWTVLQPDEPDLDTTELVDQATRQDREKAAASRRRLAADTGRGAAAAPA